MNEHFIKNKYNKHIEKYNLIHEKIELIISTQEFTTSNNYISNLYIKNKSISSLIYKKISELNNVNALSFWIYNNIDDDDFKFVSFESTNNLIKYNIFKKNKQIFLNIIKKKYINTTDLINLQIELNINLNDYGLIIYNSIDSTIYLGDNIIFSELESKQNSQQIDKINNNILIDFDQNTPNNKYIFNSIEEIILYSDQIKQYEIEHIYTKYIDFKKISNYNIKKGLETRNQIEQILNKLSSHDTNTNIISINELTKYKNDIKEIIENKDVFDINLLEKFTHNIKLHSELVLDLINQKVCIDENKHLNTICSCLKIIQGSYENLNKFHKSIENFNFISINEKFIEFIKNINKLKSYVKIKTITIEDKTNSKNIFYYDLVDKFNFLMMYEESFFYFYYGLPTNIIIFDKDNYLIPHTNQNIIISEKNYLKMFAPKPEIKALMEKKKEQLNILHQSSQINNFSKSNEMLEKLLFDIKKNKQN